jgi:hypothetical protein
MILIDLNQVLLSGLLAQIGDKKNIKLEEDLMRHMILNTIRVNIKNFKNEYGDVVLCCDNRHYWRKDFFPFYKAGRKKAREKSDLDWALIFNMLGKFKQELKDNFPYKVIDVDGAEADDVIGTLVPEYAAKEKILILSSDGDFLQLQKFPNVKQFNPSLKKYVKSENPLIELKEKIIRGDKGDGIPNILSPSDSFVRGIRQRTLTKGIVENFMSENYGDWKDENAKTGFSRNQVLIDLSLIPGDIRTNIINTFNEIKPASKQKMLNYFIEYKLSNLMDVIEEF